MGKLHKIRQAYNRLPLEEKQRIAHQRTGVEFINGNPVFVSHFTKSYRNYLKSLGRVGLTDSDAETSGPR